MSLVEVAGAGWKWMEQLNGGGWSWVEVRARFSNTHFKNNLNIIGNR